MYFGAAERAADFFAGGLGCCGVGFGVHPKQCWQHFLLDAPLILHRWMHAPAEAGLGVPMNRAPADHFLHTINRDFVESEVRTCAAELAVDDAVEGVLTRRLHRPRSRGHATFASLLCCHAMLQPLLPQDVEANIQKLVKLYGSSRISAHVKDHVKVGRAEGGQGTGAAQPRAGCLAWRGSGLHCRRYTRPHPVLPSTSPCARCSGAGGGAR